MRKSLPDEINATFHCMLKNREEKVKIKEKNKIIIFSRNIREAVVRQFVLSIRK